MTPTIESLVRLRRPRSERSLSKLALDLPALGSARGLRELLQSGEEPSPGEGASPGRITSLTTDVGEGSSVHAPGTWHSIDLRDVPVASRNRAPVARAEVFDRILGEDFVRKTDGYDFQLRACPTISRRHALQVHDCREIEDQERIVSANDRRYPHSIFSGIRRRGSGAMRRST